MLKTWNLTTGQSPHFLVEGRMANDGLALAVILILTMLLLSFPALWSWTRTSGSTILAPVLFTLQGSAIFGVLEYNNGSFSIIDDWQGVFIILSFFFSWWCFLSSYQNIFFSNNSFLLFFFFALFLFCYILFLTQSSLWFYVVFELSALPIFVIILYYGNESSRLEASLFLLLFTVLSSLWLLGSIFYLETSFLSQSLLLQEVGGQGLGAPSQAEFLTLSISGLILLPFLVNFPIFFFHIWLPNAHVEAPVGGSMVLAGILLKMGGFGLVHFAVFTRLPLWGVTIFLSFVLFSASLVGLLCFKQKESNTLIALSSVNHMALVVLGFFALPSFAFMGSMCLMVGHGILSSLLFFLSSIHYSHVGSRSLFFSGRSFFLNQTLFAFFWIVGVLLNAGFPPSLSFIGEILILLTLNLNQAFFTFFLWNFLLGGIYSITLLSSLTHGKNNMFLQGLTTTKGSQCHSFLVATLHLLTLGCFFFFENLL